MSAFCVALIIALVTAGFIVTINRRAERSNQTQILLIYIKEQLSQISALEWQVIAEKKLSFQLLVELQEARSRTQGISNKLQAIEPDNSKLQSFF